MRTERDETYMRLALDLARRAEGRTWPNPMVGAVVVRKGRIVGRGWHRQYGGPHAEVFALRQAGRRARGATLYVNLEPCAHFGRTPPCAPAVLRAGIARVVAAMRDPNPKVAGRGFALLRRAGVGVSVGLLGVEAARLNAPFLKRVRTGLPYVISKAALTLDGRIASRTGASRWITSPAARRYAHRLRAQAEVVIVGGGTVIQDDPALTVRGARPLAPGRPKRLVLAGNRPLPDPARMLRDAVRQPVIVATTRTGRLPWEGRPGVEVWRLPGADGRVRIGALLRRLEREGVTMVLVEGGAETQAAFLGLDRPGGRVWADQVQWIVAPMVMGGREAKGVVGGLGADRPAAALRLREAVWSDLGPDRLVVAIPGSERRPKAGRSSRSEA
jgi:diaminohydroxyphosphoribosylaminopyrimidine deaminase / 5-amino-6-(5-phosphoribosylamino)uracil reductase